MAGCVLWAVVSALPAGGATVPALPASGVSTPDGSWSTLPMGQLSEQSNTFWELFHAVPGSSHWTLVTPEGTADNGGLVAGVSGDSIAAGVLPSALLRFSPLSSSSDGGSSWSPVFLPGGLTRLADALAIETSGTPAGLAVVSDGTVLAATKSLGSWAPLVSTAALRRAAPSCAVSAIAAVVVLGDGRPARRHRLRAWCTGGPVQANRRIVAIGWAPPWPGVAGEAQSASCGWRHPAG